MKMIINDIGRYVTEDGSIVVIESTDNHRRAYGKDSTGMETSWYIKTGYVRSGLATGNTILIKLKSVIK